MCETCEYRERLADAERRAALAVNHEQGVMLDLTDAEARAERAEAEVRAFRGARCPRCGEWVRDFGILTPTEEKGTA